MTSRRFIVLFALVSAVGALAAACIAAALGDGGATVTVGAVLLSMLAVVGLVLLARILMASERRGARP